MATLEQLYYEYDGFWGWDAFPSRPEDIKRVEAIYDMVPSRVSSILDAGCGNGVFCNYVHEQNPRMMIVGLDRSRAALRYVVTDKVLADITRIPYPDVGFDCVAALEVLEHLPVRAFEVAKTEIARVAKEYVVICVPDSQVLGSNMTQCPSCKTMFDPDLHLRSFNRHAVQELFSPYGFTCVGTQELGAPHRVLARIQGPVDRLHPQYRHKSYMRSPLCPICGFENLAFFDDYSRTAIAGGGLLANLYSKLYFGVKRSLEITWPKVEKATWVAGLYVRTTDR